ncbi:MAG: aspartate-semialdehyde dehydrogenase [Gammaproteobacteria bacterium]|nr:aspartate-semialdehyde dehydrogenase [Gammaproteobacteria bacterium]MYH89331.1 aspartate-semialdehyde dehydrogenase [Gammaproteobacteria bacterium]
MKLDRVGFVGWRGMVGSVLMQRMMQENDFSRMGEAVFFTTSQTGQPGPDIGRDSGTLVDATDLDALGACDVIVTCQGGGYTSDVHPRLRAGGWNGYWIDAASTLRMSGDAVIILDPVNLPLIRDGLDRGLKDFIGPNCTVSLMMLALDGLLGENLVEWISVATYQAVSGAGARQMREFIRQMGMVHDRAATLVDNPDSSILDIDRQVLETLQSADLPVQEIGYPLTGNLLPWIDGDLDSGISREEWKGSVETNKILGRGGAPIPIESTCIRVGTMRCHSQALTLKLNRDLPLAEIEALVDGANDWVHVVPNQREASLSDLTPAKVTGTLDIPVGRIRKLNMGPGHVAAFTVGDQLLWGAAEPLRRMLCILSEYGVRGQGREEDSARTARVAAA